LLSTITWNGKGDGTSWSLPANWVGGVVPGASDDAVINVSGSTTINLPTGGITVHSLNQTGGILSFSSGTLTTTTGLTLTGASFNFTGGSITGPATIASSTLNLGAGAGAASFTVVPGNSSLSGSIAADESILVQGAPNGFGGEDVANLMLASGAANKGTITLQPNGPGNIPASKLTAATGTTFVNTGTIQVNAGTADTSSIAGNFTNQGTFSVGPNATLVVANSSGQTFTQASGTLSASGTFSCSGGEFLIEGGTVSAPGMVSSTGGEFVIQGGSVSGLVTAANCSLQLDGTITTATAVTVTPGTTTLMSNDSPLATVLVQGAPNGFGGEDVANLMLASGAANKGTITLQPNGPGNIPASKLTAATGTTFVNTGTIQVNAGTANTSSIAGNFTNQGTLNINGATLVVTGNSFVNQSGGTINAYGTLNVSASAFTNNGTLIDGNGAHLLNITGNYTQGAQGALNLEIGGTTAGTLFDQVAVTGQASLNGTLNLTLINGFSPVLNNAFKVLTYASATGSFATYNIPVLSSGLTLIPSQNATNLTLSALTAPSADLAVTMTASTARTVIGSDITYNVTVTNNGPSTANSVVVTDPLPLGESYVSASPSQGTATQAAGTVTVDLNTLASGATATVGIVVATASAGTLANTVTVGGQVSDPKSSNNTATQTVVVVPNQADLAVVLTATPGTVIAGNNVTYTATVTNNGPAPATSVVLTDPLPAGETYVSVTASQGTASESNGTITASLNSLANGGSAVVTIAAVTSATTLGSLSNMASVSSAVADPNQANNSDQKAIDVVADLADLAVTLTGTPGTVADGQNVTYTVNVANNGPATATSVVLTDTLPGGETYVSSSTSQGTVSQAGGTITVNLNSLAAGTSATIMITAATTAYGTQVSTASVTSAVPDSTTADNTATFSVTVDQPPVDRSQSLVGVMGTPVPIVLGATEPDGNTPIFTIVTNPAHGTLSGTAPNLTYTPAASYYGTDSFTFASSDGPAVGNIATITIVINAPPVPMPAPAVVVEGTPIPISLTASEPDGNTPTFTIVTNPAHGALSGTAPNLTYTPNAGYFGPDSFTFNANDGPAVGNPATITINVNAPPVDHDQSALTADGTGVAITLAATEPDGNTPTFTLVTNPTHGTLSGTAPNLTYTPAPGYYGTDSFTFDSSDGPAAGNIATITIVINAPPVDQDQQAATTEGAALTITLGATEPDGNTPTFTLVTNPTHGTLSGTAPNLTYTPSPGFFGPDSFTFQGSDSPATGNVATVTIAVDTPPVDAPQSVVAAAGAAIPIILGATEPDGNTPAFTIVTSPPHGTLSGTAPNVMYTPAAGYFGSDSFTFDSSDGPATGNVATVTITINAPPVDHDQQVATTEGAARTVTLGATEPDGNTPTFTVAANPTHGTLSGTAPDITYTPNPGYYGPDSFTFQASDGPAAGNVATVSIAVDAPPVDAPQSVATSGSGALSINLGASAPGGNSLTYTIVANPAHGILSGTAPNLTYTPNPGYSGPDSFVFEATNGPAAGNAVTISITVSAPPPVAPPVVTVQSISLQKTPVGKKMTTVIVVQFSGGLNPADAANVADYILTTVPKGKKARSTHVALVQAVYNPSASTSKVTLTPKKPLVLNPPLRLNITTSGILDTSGRPIAGNNGQSGSAFLATLGKTGVSIA
jgi:uncharacterized repeat protein (TIGR01451 family)